MLADRIEKQFADTIENLFPRDGYGRIALGLSSITLGPFSVGLFWLAAYGEFFGGHHGWLARLTLFALGEMGFALTLFFTCGLIWAIATPRWLERARHVAIIKLWIASTILSIAAPTFFISLF